MSNSIFFAMTCVILVNTPFAVRAEEPPPSDNDRIRQLEKRIEQLEQDAATRSLPAVAAGPSGGNAFNPAISLILDGTLADFSRNPNTYSLPGFALPDDTNPGKQGFSLGESELVMSANIDDKFYGQFTAAFTDESDVDVEEAFFETLALGHGLTVRGGRFYSGIGYLNSVHAHAWDFVDQPLVYRALFDNQYGDDGVQLRWVAPTDLLIEFGTEMFRGENYPAGGAADNGKGVTTLFVHIGGDVGVEHAWRVGLSRFDAKADDRETGGGANPDVFNGETTLTGIDVVWKWSPNGNPRERNFKFQAEYFRQDVNGTFDPASSGTVLRDRISQYGWYAQAVYQFMPRWRAGLRYDKLHANNVSAALAGTVLDNQGHDPTRTSAMVDFANSEFSRFRLQYNYDESRPEGSDKEWYLQYIMSLGAHGAHAF